MIARIPTCGYGFRRDREGPIKATGRAAAGGAQIQASSGAAHHPQA
jgi:hypothetical protein